MKLSIKKQSRKQRISPSITFGEYAYEIIKQQYRSVVKYEQSVLADDDPENLHQMRVGTRRLRTALQIFDAAITLPAVASEKQVGALARVLGGLRDLDVQVADLQTIYRPQLKGNEKGLLDETIQALKQQRRKALAAVKEALGRSHYRDLKAAYDQWLEKPKFTSLGQLPIIALLPDLLSPLLSELLLHPGWLVPANYSTVKEGYTLHDLRKAFKHVRYQAEFFVPFYGEPFKHWIDEIKRFQENLGKLQDSHVLQELLEAHLPKRASLPTLQASIHNTRQDVLADWDEVRQKYLDAAFRRQLYRMLLEPEVLNTEPETNGKEKNSIKNGSNSRSSDHQGA